MAEAGLVTILFTDIVGSTELASDLGEVAADEFRREHFAHLHEAIAATGGTEVKTIGDAVMASYKGVSPRAGAPGGAMSHSGLVTILFTDLVGSTELASELRDAAVDELRRDHFASLREAVATASDESSKRCRQPIVRRV